VRATAERKKQIKDDDVARMLREINRSLVAEEDEEGN